MKLRLILIAIVLGIFVAPVRAQSQNCTYLTWFNSGDAKNWNSGNQYIASETKTYTVTCTNTKTNATTYSGANATTATGQGGWNASYTKFIACNPIFNYTAANPPTTASDNYFENIGQDQIYDAPSHSCVIGATHSNRTYCAAVACTDQSGGCGYCPNPNPGCYPNPCGSSPIVLDLSGNGFNLTSADNGVKFDIYGTNNPIQMGWTASGAANAFLALPGVDGLVHNGKELFGNFTPQPTSDHPNGFAALAVYDDPKNGGNGDGVIDSETPCSLLCAFGLTQTMTALASRKSYTHWRLWASTRSA